MISPKYKEIYDSFITHYKKTHVNPWHNITEDQLNDIFEEITSSQDIDDDYSCNYLMNVVCKYLGGITDAHTYYYEQNDSLHNILPMNLKIFGNEVLINFPEDLRGSTVVSINGIDTETFLNELEKVTTYGTTGRMRQQMEKKMFTKLDMFSLPIFRESDSLSFKIVKPDGEEITKVFKKEEEYPVESVFNMMRYNFGYPGTYKIENDTLIITHSSCNIQFTDQIKAMVDEVSALDLTNIDTIVVDLRGNTGGNSINNTDLMEFLKNSGKKIICLTDYRVFSAGRYALCNLINLGAITIGDEISTPLNCYGNVSHGKCYNKFFSVSDSFLAPNYNLYIRTKDEYKERVNPELAEPVFFKPNIYVEQTKEDYINGVDTVMVYTLNYIKNERTR